MSDRSYFTVDEFADLLGISAATVYRSVQETGEACEGVPAIRVRRRIIIPRKPVENLLAGRPVAS